MTVTAECWQQVPRPDGKPDQLGVAVIDEPCPWQTDPSVLKLSLRMHNKFSNKSADEVSPITVLLYIR